MDPITALSVAAAAVGFFDCVYGLLRDSGSARLGNKQVHIAELDKVITDLVSFNVAMQTQLEPVEDESGDLALHQHVSHDCLGDLVSTD